MKKGKFIVLDGTDGSGKATQTKLLVNRLKQDGHRVEEYDFPQYGKKSAVLVEEYLNGKLGTAKNLGPYIPSIFYAVDRFAAKTRMENSLSQGKIIISNRYVTANLGHQGGKIRGVKKKKEFFLWLEDLEYNLFGIPKPDLTLLLHVPAKLAQELVDKKKARSYIGKKKRDIHEDDLGHLRDAERAYIQMSKIFKYPLIKSYQNGRLLTPREVSDLVWQEVKKIL